MIITYTFTDKRDEYNQPLYHFIATHDTEGELFELDCQKLQHCGMLPQLHLPEFIGFNDRLDYNEVIVQFENKCAECSCLSLEEMNDMIKIVKYAINNFNHELEKYKDEFVAQFEDDDEDETEDYYDEDDCDCEDHCTKEDCDEDETEDETEDEEIIIKDLVSQLTKSLQDKFNENNAINEFFTVNNHFKLDENKIQKDIDDLNKAKEVLKNIFK